MKYIITDSEQGGRIMATVGSVLSPLRLTGVEVTSGSAEITFVVPAGLVVWPGMLVVGKGIPEGTMLLSVDGVTAGTLSEEATVTGTGLIAVAYGYDPTLRGREVNIEHYRDVFSSAAAVQINNGGTNGGLLTMAGVGLYLENPVLSSYGGGSIGSASVTGTLAITQSDNMNHVAPREQVRKVSYVNFVCEDGTVVPQPMMPGYHISQEVED